MNDQRPAATVDPARWVDEHGDYLYRFALTRVRQPEVAEDLVQEALLAALQSAGRFAGRASERTWLTTILKNKVVDRLRRRQAVPATDLADGLAGDGDWLDGLFDASGHWRAAPGRWAADPAEVLQRREFWQAFAACLGKLPDRLRQVLSLRLLDDVPAPEICQALNVTASNLYTLLHRARLQLWRCLDRQGHGPLAGGDHP